MASPQHRSTVIQGFFFGNRPRLPISPRHPGVPQPSPARGPAIQVPPGALHLKPSQNGQRLPEAIQRRMEALFGTSFLDVRVHVGTEASAIGAAAFTHGTDLYFAHGQYNPGSPHGQRLLGHELTHVVQQRSGHVRNPFESGIAIVQDPRLEAEAERMGLLSTQRPLSPPSQPFFSGRGSRHLHPPMVQGSRAAGIRAFSSPGVLQRLVAVLDPTFTGKAPSGGVTQDIILDNDLLKLPTGRFGGHDVWNPTGDNIQNTNLDANDGQPLFVVSHGSSSDIASLGDPRKVAMVLCQRYGVENLSGRTIIFLACEAGQGKNNFIKQVANALGSKKVNNANVIGAIRETFILQSGQLRVLNFTQSASQFQQATKKLTRGTIPEDMDDSVLEPAGTGWVGYRTKNQAASFELDTETVAILLDGWV